MLGVIGHAVAKARPDSETEEGSNDSPTACAMEVSENDLVWREDAGLFHAAVHIHGLLKEVASPFAGTPHADDLKSDAAQRCVPVALFNFLAWVIDGPQMTSSLSNLDGRVSISLKLRNKALSIGQYIVYAASNGRVIPPKYVTLPMAIQHVTRSAKLVTLALEQIWSMSLSPKLLEINTGLAEDVIKSNKNLPSNIISSEPIFFGWDNNDLCKETLSG